MTDVCAAVTSDPRACAGPAHTRPATSSALHSAFRFGPATFRSVLGSYPPNVAPALAAFDGLSRACPRAVFARRPRQLGRTHSLGPAPRDGRITVMALDFVRRRAEPPSARGFRSRTHSAARRTLSTLLFCPAPVVAGCFGRLRHAVVAIRRCPRHPNGRSWSRNDSEPGNFGSRSISARDELSAEASSRQVEQLHAPIDRRPF
jgi:hypothetical protein